MDTQVLTQDTALQAWIARFRQPRPAHMARILAREAIATLNLPTRKQEAWKYTDTRYLLKTPYQAQPAPALDPGPWLIPELDADVLVFINGVYQPDLSDLSRNAGLATLCPLAEAPADLLVTYLGQLVGHDDIFSAINTVWASGGTCLHVPDHQTLPAPIHLLHLSAPTTGPLLSQYRNLLIVGAGARVSLLESVHSVGTEPNFVNYAAEVWVGHEAEMEFVKLQDESDHTTRIDTTVVRQAGNSKASVCTLTLGGYLTRNNLTLQLTEPEAEGNLYGGYLLGGTQMTDNYTQVQHIAPRCLSNELYKGIMEDKATSVFTGRIHVHKDAQKTNAYQSNRNILLSDTATANTRPQLEIYADDVKCSHGAATGRLDEDALYYLRARGIPAPVARKMLIQAFIDEVIDRISSEPLRKHLAGRVTQRFM